MTTKTPQKPAPQPASPQQQAQQPVRFTDWAAI